VNSFGRNRPSRDGDLDGDDQNLMFAQDGMALDVLSEELAGIFAASGAE
jgi:hypothetical protein